MTRIKTSEIKQYREDLLNKQNGFCALCGERIIDNPVLDHDHKTGYIRGVLHRGCNAFLGNIENNLARNQIGQSRLRAIFDNFFRYIQKQQLHLHPTHRTPEEKKELQKKRARARRAKKNEVASGS